MDIGDRFERRVRLSQDDIVRFAADVGDTNPLHHDEEFAATSRFGGLIASGAHSVAISIAMCGARATPDHPGVGLEFAFTLLGAAKPNEEIVFGWEVVSIEPSEKPRGTIVHMRGDAAAQGDRPLLRATAKLLMFETRGPNAPEARSSSRRC